MYTHELIGLSQLPMSGGHPLTDVLMKQFNSTLKQMLAKVRSKQEGM